MRNVFLAVLALVLFGCSSDDDGATTNLDLELLYGQWYNVGLCREQNSLLLNENGTFEAFSSNAIDCDNTELDTYKVTGNYTINGNFYNTSNEVAELVIDGSELSIFEATNLNIKREIIGLTETTLIIKVFEEDANIISIFGEFEYER